MWIPFNSQLNLFFKKKQNVVARLKNKIKHARIPLLVQLLL